jgi:hypothetical protein
VVGRNVRNSGDVYRLIPDIHKGVTSFDLLGQRNIFIKSHLKYFDEMPLREDTVGVVYVARNPLDVIASAVNYLPLRDSDAYSKASEEQRQEARQSLLNEFLEKGGPDRWSRMGMGTWPEHVVSWHRKDMPFPRVTLKYEDLKTRPAESVAHLCQFLNLDLSTDQIEAVLAASSFESMRAMEEKEVAEGQPGLFAAENPAPAFSLGLRFMSKGTTGSYREVLTDAQIEIAKERFGPVMKQLGYE